MKKKENKFKDRIPQDTIQLVKDFMLRNEILPIEKWQENSPGLYSVSLSFENLSYHVNGKGTSHAYALASAYGEFMERFQNMAFIRMHSRVIDIMPSIDVNLENTKENQKMSIKSLQQKMSYKNPIKLPMKSLEKYLTLKCGKILKCCEFKDVSDHENFLIPYGLLDYYYGTNGMVAGNTVEEAYVEGLSEILERYVVRVFIENKYTPPYLDAGLLEQFYNYQEIKAYINALERSGKYKVELRDLSMGVNIPAIGLILYQISKPAYLVKVGVHPVLEIAVERCFTELLQGQMIDQYVGMMSLIETETELQKEINIHNFYANGRGAFPLPFFGAESSFPSKKSKESFDSNKQMKDHLISLIFSLGYRIYAHNSTNSELVAFQFIVPGMSEGISLAEITLKNLIEDIQISDLLKFGLCNFNKQQAQTVINYLDICGFDEGMPIGRLIMDVNLKRTSIYNQTPINVLKFYLALFIGDYSAALMHLKKINVYLRGKKLNNLFYGCYEDYLSLISANTKESARTMLSHFYPEKIIKQVMHSKASDFLKSFYEINCNLKCKECYCSNDCLTKNDALVYRQYLQATMS